MATLFISDLHLQEERPDLTQAFFNFLELTVQANDQLYILGDFFEVSVGDDLFSDYQINVCHQLKKLQNKNVTLHVMHGNRDFLLGKRFCKLSGAQLLKDPTPVKFGLMNVLLSHGDLWCTEDEAYQKYRRFVRNPIAQWIFLRLPKKVRQRIGDKLRHNSKGREIQDYSILDVTPETIEQEMLDRHIPMVIHGHTHRPARHPLPELAMALHTTHSERIVLGDWDKTGWYLKFDNNKFDLIEFEINV